MLNMRQFLSLFTCFNMVSLTCFCQRFEIFYSLFRLLGRRRIRINGRVIILQRFFLKKTMQYSWGLR